MNVCKLTGDYVFYKEPIGYGSFSIIYKGYNISEPNKPLAIKRITKIIDMKYFHNEVDLMKKLDHPNILKLYDVVKTNGNIYLILEYCNCGDLSEYIQNDTNNSNNFKYFKQIFRGLEYLYKNRILHRDIKPHNILIKDGLIKISDFGFAKSFEKNELITTFCGSPLYMAPEIIKDKEYNLKSDIWSLGVIIYELFTKTHPYYVESKQLLWSKIKQGIIIDYSNIKNQHIAGLLKKMLVDNPLERSEWEAIFKIFHTIDCIDNKPSLYDCSDEMMFEMDELNSSNAMVRSEIIKRKPHLNEMSFSVNPSSSNESFLYESEDYKIISRSAPNQLAKSYLRNYIKDKNNNADKQLIPILGNEPEPTKSIVNSIIDISLKTVKSYFPTW
jgi:serine/threonine protein kinase